VFFCKTGSNHFDQEVERIDAINAAGTDDRGKSFSLANLSGCAPMTKEETWQRLTDLKVVKGEMPTEAWNFHGLDLNGLDLNGVNFQDVDLSEASLINVNFSNANLSGADLIGAHLRGANLSSADLTEADLYGADLTGANLSLTSCLKVDLSDAILKNVNLRGRSRGRQGVSRGRVFA
jgi:uncharacterized protein YjbI with pentapeptide repeats